MLHPVYEELLQEWETELDELERKIFQALRNAMPNGVTRRHMVYIVFGVTIPEGADINNNKYDRKIRKTIEVMREKLIPVFSSSSESGYRLVLDETTISMMIAEWQNKRDNYTDKINQGQKLLRRIRDLGERAIPDEMPEQPKLFSLFG